MNIEQYAKLAPQYYSDDVPELLKFLLLFHAFDSYLDCGCGDGSLLYAVTSEGLLDTEMKNVSAVDLSSTRIEIVRSSHQKVDARVDSAESLSSVLDNSIDVLVSTMVIEHVDDVKMLNSISRVLKPSGMVYLTTVFKKKYGWYFYKNADGKWAIDPTHLREYMSENELLKHLPATLQLVYQQKRLHWFPIVDFFIKRLNIKNRSVFQNPLLRELRKVKVPILGYYTWELILKKV